MDALLVVNRLEVQFGTAAGVLKAVRGVSFTLKPGAVLAIAGESGSGKSVTARSILRLIPEPPGKITGGSIRFDGEELLHKSERQMQKIRGSAIGMVFPNPLSDLNPVLTVGTQIMESMRLHRRLNARQARCRAVELLNRVGFPKPERNLKRYPHQCSGGMRQRVAIAMALACEPKLLIADEPTSALDATIQAQVLEAFWDIKQERRTAMLLITHDLGVVAGLADRILVLYAGCAIETGPVETVLAGPLHPYTRGLLQSAPRLNMGPEERLVPIPGRPPDPVLLPAEQCPFLSRCDYARQICSQGYPPLFPKKGSRWVRCWLHHPLAPSSKLYPEEA